MITLDPKQTTKHANPFEVIPVRPLSAKMESTKTSTLFKTQMMEALRLVLPAGTQNRDSIYEWHQREHDFRWRFYRAPDRLARRTESPEKIDKYRMST